MLLETLAEYKTVEAAAKDMAGNWTQWKCFMWFGSKDVPNSDKVMLAYLKNHEETLRQLTNVEYVRGQLSRWWGDMTKGSLVGEYGASVSGENILSGLMMRVVDDQGKITKPFRKLFSIAKEYHLADDRIIDDETFERVRKREMTAYVHRELGYECRQRGVEFSTELVEQVTRELISGEVDYDNDDLDKEIADVMGWNEDEEDD